jgi:mannose-6-phosphate isomerase-like protein (cupin superfamily)
MSFLIATIPKWRPETWSESDEGYGRWHKERPLGGDVAFPWETGDLQFERDYLAPDGSEIRLLPTLTGGGFSHCTLPGAATSQPIKHSTVDEIWYILEGTGQVWRREADEQEIIDVRPNVCLSIASGTSFQFRAEEHGPLRILIGTYPPWPGADEAVNVEGYWSTESKSER